MEKHEPVHFVQSYKSVKRSTFDDDDEGDKEANGDNQPNGEGTENGKLPETKDDEDAAEADDDQAEEDAAMEGILEADPSRPNGNAGLMLTLESSPLEYLLPNNPLTAKWNRFETVEELDQLIAALNPQVEFIRVNLFLTLFKGPSRALAP